MAGGNLVRGAAAMVTLATAVLAASVYFCSHDMKTDVASPVAVPRGSRFQIDTYPVLGPVPWALLSQSTRDDYTLNGTVKVINFMVSANTSKLETSSPVWTRARVDFMVSLVDKGDPHAGRMLSIYGAPTNMMFFQALKEWPVRGLNVLVVGSRDPWVEAFCLSFGAASVTTVDFNPPQVDYPRMRTYHVSQLEVNDERFDAIFSYSSLEHDGLGRYGDPLNPWGDLERMKKLKTLLKPEGKLYLGVPNGNDTLAFNAHRIYGPIRFPLLIQGWNLLKTYARTPLDLLYQKGTGYFEQPLHVLSLEKASDPPDDK